MKENDMRAMNLTQTAALVLGFALSTVPAQAQRQSGVDGNTAGLDSITGTGLDTVVSTVITIPDTDSSWHCVATCSMEVDISVAALDIDGRCALERDGVEVAGTDRRFELNNDPDIGTTSPINVTTTGGMSRVSLGDHTVSCACAKVSGADANYNVNDSSLSVVCSDFALD